MYAYSNNPFNRSNGNNNDNGLTPQGKIAKLPGARRRCGESRWSPFRTFRVFAGAVVSVSIRTARKDLLGLSPAPPPTKTMTTTINATAVAAAGTGTVAGCIIKYYQRDSFSPALLQATQRQKTITVAPTTETS